MSLKIALPHAGIVVLVGPSNSGKTTFLNRLADQGILKRSEIVSSDQFRILVSDTDFIDLGSHSKNQQEALYVKYQQISEKAFEVMGQLINVRCALGKLTVVDATHLWPDDRKKAIDLAYRNHVPAMAIVLDLPETILLERDARREHPRGRNWIQKQVLTFKNNVRSIKTEGFSATYFLNEVELEQRTFVRSLNPLVKEVGVDLDFIDIQGGYHERFSPPNILSFLNGYSVSTEDYGEITIQEKFAKSSIEEVSHYTIPIEELVYIPPTMSPATDPSPLEDYLEHPKEAFEYYRKQGVTTMVVEKKHMGSRATLLLFKDAEAAVDHVGKPTLGTIYTRKGRTFFNQVMTQTILEQLNADLNRAEYFAKNNTDFVLLDAEILPWNLKAKELISAQYAHVSEVALMDRQKILEKLQLAQENGWEVNSWLEEYRGKLDSAVVFRDVFQKYCWDTHGIEGIKIAPFHVLAQSDQTYFDQSHLWHMEQNQEFAKLSNLFIETEFKVVTDETSGEEAIRWWQEMTENGNEGFVVKPEIFVTKNAKGRLIQPAIKVRGRKYLHIIYGIDYLQPENLIRLKQRNVGHKQRKALMELSLGIEGVKRFVNKEPIARIHECVLATLALETEPVDPRL